MRLPVLAKNFLYKTNKILGVEVCLTDSGMYINCCLCEQKDSKVSVVFSKDGLESIGELLKVLPKNDVPISLMINGKGIIHKKISVAANETPQTALHKIFATGNDADFYSQLYQGPNDQGYSSVIRRDKVDELVADLQANGNKVIDFFLGPFVIENVLTLQGHRGSVHVQEWEQHKVEVEDNRIKEYGFNPTAKAECEANLNGILLKGPILNSFSAALNYFVAVATIQDNNLLVKNSYKEFGDQKAFGRLSKIVLASLLSICLMNFLVFNSYFEKQRSLNDQLAVKEGAISSYEKLNKVYQDKMALLERSGLAVNSRSSYISDRLLYDLPEDIRLNSMTVFPIKNQIERDSIIEFDSKKIVAKGLCDKSIILNNWINLLKTKEFIEDVVLNNYEQESEKEGGRFDLTIKLK